MQEDTLFTSIVKGEVPCHKIYEDARTMAFLDIYPIQPGQVLVISKAQVEFAWDLDDLDYQAVMATSKKVAQRLRQFYPDIPRVALIIEGLEVPHTHVKVFPFTTDVEFRRLPDRTIDPDHAALAALAQKLAI